MRMALVATDNVAQRVYDGNLGYNTVLDVPAGSEAVYIRNGAVEAVLREGSSGVNTANPLKALSKCKDAQQIYIVNRAGRFEVLWGTGGIPFTDAAGRQRQAGANGSYAFAVDSSVALLKKFGYPETLTVTDVKMRLKSVVTAAVKEAVVSAIASGGYNVGARTEAIRSAVQGRLEREFDDVGLFLDVFRIEEVTDIYGGDGGEETGEN